MLFACCSLTKIVIPSTVALIEAGCFSQCFSLKEVDISNALIFHPLRENLTKVATNWKSYLRVKLRIFFNMDKWVHYERGIRGTSNSECLPNYLKNTLHVAIFN